MGLIHTDGHPITTVRIRNGKEKQMVRHHPWVFSGALDAESKKSLPDDPAIVQVEDWEGRFIAFGWYDALSHIPIRLLSWDKSKIPDATWWVDTLGASVQRRLDLFKQTHTNAFRLVHGEADFLPGLTVDLYGDRIVCIVSARVAWTHRLLFVQTLQRMLNPSVIIVWTDSSFGGIEQLKESTEYYVDGKLIDAPAPDHIHFKEHDIVYGITIGSGQKSGFFCDQRENRVSVAAYAKGRDVLDAFCYSGAFSLHALANGAKSVTSVDSSAPALAQLSQNIKLNIGKNTITEDSLSHLKAIQADVFQYLRDMDSQLYDLIILDPPKLAQTKAQVDGALRAYKDLNRLAIQKIRDGGIIATFSCSGGVSREQLRTVLAWAAKDVGREVQILETLGQALDHPIRLSFPESEYLKGYIYRVL